MRFSRCARGVLLFASKARFGPVPLRFKYLGALRGIGPALAEEALGRMRFSRCARGFLLFASKARFGPIPLRLAYFGAPRDRSCARRERWGQAGLSRWRAREDRRGWPVGLGSLRSSFWRGGSGEASLGFQLPDQGFAGGEDAFVGGDGVGHGAELVSQTIAGAGGLQDANQRVHGEVDGEEQAAALR
jgi:hypothetical protein